MPGVFDTLEQRVVGFVKAKLKLGSMTVGHVQEICKFQREYLDSFIDCFGAFTPKDLNNLRNQYLAKAAPQIRKEAKRIILDMKQELHGKAGLFERNGAFGAAHETAKKLIKIVDEISKNAKNLVQNQHIKIEESKITDVVMLGILRECDLFTKYTSNLWEMFLAVIDDGASPAPYRINFLLDNQEAYFEILENVCDKAHNYTFLNEIDAIKRNNADLLLYANNNSFLSFLNPSNYTKSHELHVKHGIIGFNIFSWIASKWRDWEYSQLQKTKKHREWLRQEEFRFKQILMEQDPNSPAAKETKKYIEAYSAEIARLDQQINEIEGEGN